MVQREHEQPGCWHWFFMGMALGLGWSVVRYPHSLGCCLGILGLLLLLVVLVVGIAVWLYIEWVLTFAVAAALLWLFWPRIRRWLEEHLASR